MMVVGKETHGINRLIVQFSFITAVLILAAKSGPQDDDGGKICS